LTTIQYSWDTCPSEIKRQLVELLEVNKQLLLTNLKGFYLHGSLAMGCFNPKRSDIDIIVVVESDLKIEIKSELVKHLLEQSNNPNPIEISYIKQEHLLDWVFPTPYEFHYSEHWRDWYTGLLIQNKSDWTLSETDPDLAAHLVILKERGICLYGDPISKLRSIPKEHYISAILSDIANAEQSILVNPVYIILNLCRVYLYISQQKITSKDEAGVLAQRLLTSEFSQMVEKALFYYRSDQDYAYYNSNDLDYTHYGFEKESLETFARCMEESINELIK
jgi:predicted nucleotidyltransferase